MMTEANSDTSVPPTGQFPPIIELNVGGVFYTTSLSTLTRHPDSFLGEMFTGRSTLPLTRDSKGKYFIDRDGVLFRYVLDYLRNDKLVLPENFHEKERLRSEAEFFRLGDMMSISVASASKPAHIVIGYRGSFAFGRDGMADVKFRKLSRILVCGRVWVCREVFGETLNESRDPDRGSCDRYTGRFFLKHSFLEQAFDMLLDAGFKCVAACGSGTACGAEVKPGVDSEESKWNHYNEFVFTRP
uniref:BTB domain-containing protein n=1 Tax=Strigamia maritima TaxID=126957 RepID=T1IPD2_STRMM